MHISPATDFVRALWQVAACMKDRSFRSEKEWRVVSQPLVIHDQLMQHLHVRHGRGIVASATPKTIGSACT